MTVRETCVLNFGTSTGRGFNVRIRDPRPGLSAGAVTSAAAMFVSANPFDNTVGNLTDLAGAELVTQTTRTII